MTERRVIRWVGPSSRWFGRCALVAFALLLILATTPALASLVPARVSGSTTPRTSISAQPFPCLLSSSYLLSLPTSAYREYRWNALTKLSLPGGTTSEYGHDALQRVTSSTTRDPGGNPLLSRGYQYTPSGDLAAMTTERGLARCRRKAV